MPWDVEDLAFASGHDAEAVVPQMIRYVERIHHAVQDCPVHLRPWVMAAALAEQLADPVPHRVSAIMLGATEHISDVATELTAFSQDRDAVARAVAAFVAQLPGFAGTVTAVRGGGWLGVVRQGILDL